MLRTLVPVLCSLCIALPAAADETAALGGSYLGIHTRSNSNVLEATNLEEGVTVTRVGENSPASAAGVKPGDVLLQANGRAIAHPSELDELVEKLPVGGEVKLKLERDDVVLDVAARTVALIAPLQTDESQSDSSEEKPVEPTTWIERRHVGFEFGPPSEERMRELGLNPREGVEVRRVASASPLRSAGIEPGALLLKVDGKSIRDPASLIDFLDALTTEEKLTWTVGGSGGATRDVAVPTYKPEQRLQRLSLWPVFRVERSREKSEYSFLLGLFHVERYEAGSRLSLLYFFDLKTGTWDELLEVEGS
jgi:predicted metalloprotease with PDZ domain